MQSETIKRNHGIDLLKIVAMLLVLLLHVLGQGGILGKLMSPPQNFCLNMALLGC